MKHKAKLLEATSSAWRKVTTLVIEINGLINTERLKDKTLAVDVDVWRERRSLSANAYFHVLCEKLAAENGISTTHQKNDLIGSYGKTLYIGGEVASVITNMPPHEVAEIPSPHFKYIGHIGGDKNTYSYEIRRGSHTYDSKEMSELINGAVAEAQDAGIDTMTPDEIAHLTSIWKPKEGFF